MARAAYKLPTYPSLVACCSDTGIPKLILSAAKKAGCPAFRGGHVNLREFIAWHFGQPANDPGVDWSGRLKQMQAQREEIRLQREQGEAVDLAGILEQDAAKCAEWNARRVQFEQEWPLRLAGREVAECRTVLREMLTDVGRLLEASAALSPPTDQNVPASPPGTPGSLP